MDFKQIVTEIYKNYAMSSAPESKATLEPRYLVPSSEVEYFLRMMAREGCSEKCIFYKNVYLQRLYHTRIVLTGRQQKKINTFYRTPAPRNNNSRYRRVIINVDRPH